MAAKKVKDYVKPEEPIVTLAGRIPVSKKQQVEKKMKKDGIKSTQDLVNAMVDAYLSEGK